jgi:N-acetylglucosamine-1-phosphodiester alpha-N-acetylglucosaminidase
MSIFLFSTLLVITSAELRPYPNDIFPLMGNTAGGPLDFFAMNPDTSNVAQISHKFVNQTVKGFNYTFTGHLLTLSNPIGHFSILPPNGGCGNRVNTTVTAETNGCLAATNGGFFNMDTGACIGNIVSNGTAIELPATANANFGVLKNNSFLIGYMTSDQIASVNASSQIMQLISGSVWIVRNGADYVNESASFEGTSASFIAEAAPRVCIGHDKMGQLLILEIDGNESLDQGPDLHTFANFAISFGFVNAVNIDGGGSSTVDVHNTLCSSCGLLYDTCVNAAFGSADTCQRAVTTITCLK